MILVVENLSKRLGGRTVVDGVDLACEAGTICVIAGANGAGKSTLLRMIAGIIEPDRGVIEIAGEALHAAPVAARRSLGYVPEAANPPGYMTGEELFGLIQVLKRAPPLDSSVREALGLDAIAGERTARLSLGQRRRVCLGAALIGDPPLLVLDEPTNGLDRDGLATLLALLETRRSAGATALVATHDRDFAAAIANRHLYLEHGRLSERGPVRAGPLPGPAASAQADGAADPEPG